jgi:MFS family permease
MPIIQTGLLVFFLTDAYLQFWYDNGLIGMAFLVGCLGGAVYVGGFALIGDDVPKPLKEFSMGAAAIAMNIGVVGSTIAAIFIQRGIYEYYGIEGDQR